MKKILVIGSLNMDFSIKTDKLPVPGQTVTGKSFHLNPGGKGANQAYAMGKIGSNVTMLGMVGNDEYADKLIDNLKSVNVETENIKIADDNTGVAFVTVDENGENSIIVISGANQKLTTDLIDDRIIDEADIVVIQLEIPLDTVLYCVKKAKEKNKLVVLDPAPAKENIDEILSYVDIVKPNETELKTITNMNTDDPLAQAQLLLQKGVKNVIVTMGEKGSLLVNQNTVKKFKAYDVKAIDTTAAGDSFIAALVNYLSKDKSLEEAISFAHLVSSIVVTKRGAQESIPTLDEIFRK